MAILHHLTAHPRDLGGGFTVRRLLPASACRSVGPFIFFDHFGPVEAQPGERHDVRPHPHIGLATVTYLFEGAIMHRDSLGSVQRIEPGAINWMSAGRGIVHSERTPEDLAPLRRSSHGLQMWVALPREFEECTPEFVHYPAGGMPELVEGGAVIRVLVGEMHGARSPVATASETLYLDVALAAGASLRVPAVARERALYCVAGEISVDGVPLPPHTLAVLRADAAPQVATVGPARFVVIGGEPLAEPRYMWWNFVSTRKERIREAADDWAAQRFAAVPGDAERIPLPDSRFA